MTLVRLLPLAKVLQTRVWVSDSAKKQLAKLIRKSNEGAMFAKKLKECAIAGFHLFHGKILVFEWSGVYRFGIRASLFRMVGFYDGTDFIFIEAYTKPGTSLSESNTDAINRVAAIRTSGDWSREENGQ